MATHWTCAVPKFVLDLERTHNGEQYPIDDTEMTKLYGDAGTLLNRTTTVFSSSARHLLVKQVLHEKGFGSVKELPLAVSERPDVKKSDCVSWRDRKSVV